MDKASKAKKNYSKFSTITMPKTRPVQNLLRYIVIDKKKLKKFENPITKNKKTKQNVNFPAPPILNIFFSKNSWIGPWVSIVD